MMNPVLKKILETGLVETAEGELREPRGPVSEEEGRLLQELVQQLKPKVSLEVGLACGVSAMFICDGLEQAGGGRHIVIDPNQEGDFSNRGWGRIGLLNLERAGHGDKIEFFNQPSHRALPQIEAQGRRIQFAFIDGWHTFDYVLVDFFYIDKMLDVGGVVVFDDVNWPAIRDVCRFVAKNCSYRVLRCAGPSGVGGRLKAAAGGKFSLRRSLKSGILRHPIRKTRRILGELVGGDAKLGVYGSCVAFRKESEDGRPCDFHVPF